MEEVQNNNVVNDVLKIESYSLGDYTRDVMNAVAKGYTMSEDNDKYPYHFGGGAYYAVFVKVLEIPEAPVVVPITVTIDTAPVSEVVSKPRGRRPKQ